MTSVGQQPPRAEEVVIGKKRPQGNPLIGHYEVGRSWHARLSPHFDDPHYTYGMALKRDPEGAGDVVLSWKGHTQSPPAKNATEKDFLRMNRRAAKLQCVSPKAVNDFRKAHDMRIPRTRQTKDRSLPRAVRDPGMVFGQRTKEDVSIGELIANKFEMEWIELQKGIEERDREQRRQRQQKKNTRRRQFIHKVQQDSTPLHPKEYFTMRRFRDIPSKFSSATPEPTSAPRPARLPPLSHTPEPAATC